MGPTVETAPAETTTPIQVWIPKLLGSGVGVARTLYCAGVRLVKEKLPSLLLVAVEATVRPVFTLIMSISQTVVAGLTVPEIPPVFAFEVVPPPVPPVPLVLVLEPPPAELVGLVEVLVKDPKTRRRAEIKKIIRKFFFIR